MPQHVAFAANPRERRNTIPAKRIGGRLKQALDLMIWGDGERRYLPDNEAAAKAGLNVLSIRLALQRPHVLAYYKQQREVLRARESPANIHRLVEIRDFAPNLPAIHAIRLLEQIGDEQTNKPNLPTPGVTIRIVSLSSPPEPVDIKSNPRIIDAE
jgi:hypothetical protein